MKTFFTTPLMSILLIILFSNNYNAQTHSLSYNSTYDRWDVVTDNPGYISIGCQNTLDYAHINTDKSKFYFGKSIYLNGTLSSYNTLPLQFQTNGTNRMYISQYGKVGVGNTSPLYNLDVTGTFRATSDAYLDGGIRMKNSIRIYNENSPYDQKIIIGYNSSLTTGFFDFDTKLYFRNDNNNNISPLLLQDDGTVAINVTPEYTPNQYYNTQGYSLAVNGGILCEKVKVISNVPNSDHVFNKDYNLMSIDELKAFIDKNKHLPEIPSAKEFKENGYDVGTMDDLLLRKIEELTLYILKLQEDIKILKAEQ